MAAPQVVPVEKTRTDADEVLATDRPWVTIVWNDPVNLMSYVTWVFQKLFGYSRDKAEALMLDVHHKGKAAVSSGARERMEHDGARLHGHTLWATADKPGARPTERTGGHGEGGSGAGGAGRGGVRGRGGGRVATGRDRGDRPAPGGVRPRGPGRRTAVPRCVRRRSAPGGRVPPVHRG